jgi:epoxide hydrolase-like predicted phosphatase
VSAIEAVISDFGGVLTTPLIDAFAGLQETSGISLESLGRAMFAIAQRTGLNPLVELETGRMTEADFLAGLGAELSRQLGREVELHGFGEAYFGQLAPNPEMIDYLGSLRDRGLRLALCTNNVREWESRWRSMLPVDELFELVVDSAFVGARKPDREIYEITLERLGVEPAAAVFLDDTEVNCDAARELGLHAVHFRDNGQAIAEIEALLPRRRDGEPQFSDPSRSQQ